MSDFTVRALVMRAARYKDYDKVLTLFAQGHGRVTATARGCMRPKAALRALCEPLVYAEFALVERMGRCTVTGGQMLDPFYDLRKDVQRLAAASLLMQLAEGSVREGLAGDETLSCLLRAFADLAYGERGALEQLPGHMLAVLEVIGYKPPVAVRRDDLHALITFAERCVEYRLKAAALL